MKSEIVFILDQLDPRAPRVEDERDLEQPRDVADYRSVVVSLQPDACAAHADRFELRHLGVQIRNGEADVVDAGALAAAAGRLRNEDEFHAVAVGGVVAVGERLAPQVLRVPLHSLGRAGRGDVHVVQLGRSSKRRSAASTAADSSAQANRVQFIECSFAIRSPTAYHRARPRSAPVRPPRRPPSASGSP